MLDDKPWVDGPWEILETPSKTKDVRSHAAVFIADDMAKMHNVLIRGMNSIYLQAPHLHSLADVQDFLFYIHCWCSLVEMHHTAEESVLFPAIEALLHRQGDLFSHSVAQHLSFAEGVHALHDYAQNTEAAKYDGGRQVRALLKTFAYLLHTHLEEEVHDLLALEDQVDSDKLLACHREADKVRQPARPEEIYPLFFGLADNTFEGNGSGRFPAAPFFMPWLIHWWMARKHQGAWRFLPCDFWGTPRPLAFTSIT